MRGVLYLSWRHVAHHRLRSSLLAASVAVALFVPAVTRVLIARYDRDLRARGESTPLVVGRRGNNYDLVLAALYWRRGKLPPLPVAAFDELRDTPGVTLVPLHARFEARGLPVVATTPEYHERRGLRPVRGTAPLALGDVTLGAEAAAALGLGPGDHLFSDPTELYDISKPPALEMTVAGVFAPTGTPDDAAVFVDVKTAWVLEGAYHGHADAEAVASERPELVLGAADERLALSGALIEYNRVDDGTRASFHFHGTRADLPLTALLAWPDDHKARTLFKTRVNSEGRWHVVSPAEVIAELLAVVFRVKALLDRFLWLLVVATGALVALVLTLSTRLRARELATLDRMGCGRGTIPGLIAVDAAWLLGAGAAAGVALTALAAALVPDLVHLV